MKTCKATYHFALFLLCGVWPLLHTLPATAATPVETCLLNALQQAENTATVGELRVRCQAQQGAAPAVKGTTAPASTAPAAAAPTAKDAKETEAPAEPTAFQKRLALETKEDENKWAITPHKPNYFLPITYNSHLNRAPYEFTGDAQGLKDTEAKFQFSVKFPLARNIIDGETDAYFAYTHLSFWQVYASDISAPFRETNYEPEFFLVHKNDWQILGWTNSLLSGGFVHQSNGRAEPLSRSWNRIYVQALFEKENWGLAFKPWYRIPEDAKSDPNSAKGDDNPDIQHYMGYGEVRLAYHKNDHVVSILERNSLTMDWHNAFELDYSFPLYGKMKGYVQYFNGYGESLIDYNARTNRIGIGIAISDWY